MHLRMPPAARPYRERQISAWLRRPPGHAPGGTPRRRWTSVRRRRSAGPTPPGPPGRARRRRIRRSLPAARSPQGGPRPRRAPPRPDDGPGPPRNFTAYEVEDHVDLARRLLEASAFRVDELVGPELAHEPFGPLPSRGHDTGARAAGQLDGEDADAASRTVDQHALACRETSMVEQRLPGRQGGQRDGGGPLMVQRVRLRGEVARLDGNVARRRAVPIPVREAVYLISYRETGGAVAQSGDHARDLVCRDRRGARVAGAVHPGGRPVELRGDEARGAHFEQHVPDSGRGREDALIDKFLRATPRLRTQRLHRPSRLDGGFVHHTSSFRRLIPCRTYARTI